MATGVPLKRHETAAFHSTARLMRSIVADRVAGASIAQEVKTETIQSRNLNPIRKTEPRAPSCQL